jgi:hypothetical protein
MGQGAATISSELRVGVRRGDRRQYLMRRKNPRFEAGGLLIVLINELRS